jgi:hypothetical protein
VLGLIAAEGLVRYIDGYVLTTIPLSEASWSRTVRPAVVDGVPLGAGVQRDWFSTDPTPLPNRVPVPAAWQDLFRSVEDNAAAGNLFRGADAFKAWNSVFAGNPCEHWFLHLAPGQLYLYDPTGGSPRPRYRYLPGSTLPSAMVTNQIGWRGAPIEHPRGARSVRIVFVGASTTLDSPYMPFSWPEFVGLWLNHWAKSKGLDVHFEALNAGRDGIDSSDIAAVVRTEVLPLRPELVVYYEGSNQFSLRTIVPNVPEPAVSRTPSESASAWLRSAARYSALAGRVKAAAVAINDREQDDGREPTKPDYKIEWPKGLDEQDPDLSYPRLPLNLNTILRDLDEIRGDLAGIGSDFAFSSFMWFVKDGMVLDPVRYRYILEQLNVLNYPFRYRDVERLAAFQNRVFAKYAAAHGLIFLDIAHLMPFEPDLFLDAIHTSYAGTRVRAWVAFNQLLPTIEKHIADGSWPRPWPVDAPTALPTFTPRHVTFNCGPIAETKK